MVDAKGVEGRDDDFTRVFTVRNQRSSWTNDRLVEDRLEKGAIIWEFQIEKSALRDAYRMGDRLL